MGAQQEATTPGVEGVQQLATTPRGVEGAQQLATTPFVWDPVIARGKLRRDTNKQKC